jgi:hypothetical protein
MQICKYRMLKLCAFRADLLFSCLVYIDLTGFSSNRLHWTNVINTSKNTLVCSQRARHISSTGQTYSVGLGYFSLSFVSSIVFLVFHRCTE